MNPNEWTVRSVDLAFHLKQYRCRRGADVGVQCRSWWYHTHRKSLYAQRAARAAAMPTGCYVSHSKYCDEAVRIAATGRLAFSAGK